MINSLNIRMNSKTGNLVLMLKSGQGEAVFYYDENGRKTTVAGDLDLAHILPNNIGFTLVEGDKAT